VLLPGSRSKFFRGQRMPAARGATRASTKDRFLALSARYRAHLERVLWVETSGSIRAAVLSTEGYKGAEGEYNFDQFGDGLHGYNIVRNEKGVVIFDKHIEFAD
jgi:hypothetical protein